MESYDRDQVDDLLDAAMKRYGDVEPRPGLEGRVLARLGEVSHTTRRRWIWASAATACACVLAIVGRIGTGRKEPSPPISFQPAKVVVTQNHGQSRVGQQPIHEVRSTEKHALRKSARHLATARPRLEQFPSPRPLSDQEKLLVAYVSDYPKQAAEVAQEQGKREQELQAMYPVPGPDSN